jgi:hypothetical protein
MESTSSAFPRGENLAKSAIAKRADLADRAVAGVVLLETTEGLIQGDEVDVQRLAM